MRGHPKLVGFVGLIALVGVSAGCGSSSSSGASVGSGTTATNAPTSSCVTKARNDAAVATQLKSFTPPSQPVPMKKIAGDHIYVISVDQADSFDAEETAGAVAAAQAAGLKPVVFDGKGEVTLFNQGVQEAVAQHASGIVLEGIDPHLVSGPLAQAKSAGIPAIDSFNGPPDQPLEPGIVAHVPANYTLAGKELAAWILADSACNADTLVFNAPVFSILKNTMQGFQQEYSLCKSCKLTVRNIDLSTMTTDLQTGASEALRADPKINYIFGTFDAMIPDILPEVEAAGSTAKIVGHDGLPTNLGWIRDGKQAADGALPDIAVLGWACIDVIGRALTHEPLTPYILPDRVVDKANIPSTNSAVFPAFANYQSQFKKLWGVS